MVTESYVKFRNKQRDAVKKQAYLAEIALVLESDIRFSGFFGHRGL